MPMTDVPLQLDLAVRVLGHETRRAIFDQLWRVSHHPEMSERGLTFEELRRAVGEDSGPRLSYHLEEMKAHGETVDPHAPYEPERETPVMGSTRAQLVIKREERYFLDPVIGRRILQLWALAHPVHEPLGPTEIPWDCPHCGREITAAYRNHRLDMWCPEHTELIIAWTIPGDTEAKSITDIIRLASLQRARRFQTILAGFCNACSGRIDRTITSREHGFEPLAEALDESVSFPHEVAAYASSAPEHKWNEPFRLQCSCRNCELCVPLGLGYLTCYRPQAMNFFAGQGIDIVTEPMSYRFIEHSGTVLSVDPVRIRVRLGVDGTTRNFVVDDTARIVAVDAEE